MISRVKLIRHASLMLLVAVTSALISPLLIPSQADAYVAQETSTATPFGSVNDKVISPETVRTLTELKRISVTLDGYEGFGARNSSWALSPDGKELAVVAGKTIRTCAVDGFTQVEACPLLADDSIIARYLTYTADGRLVVVGDYLSILIYNNGVQEYVEHPEPMKDRQATLRQTSAVAFTPDGRYFVATQPKALIIYDVAEHYIAAEYTWESLGIRTPGFSSISVNADRSLITLDNGSRALVIRILDTTRTPTVTTVFNSVKSQPVRDIVVTPDGAILAGVGYETALFWDRSKLAVVPSTVEFGERGMKNGMIASPDSRLLAAYGGDGLFIFDAYTREILKTVTQSAISAAFSADGSVLGIYDSGSSSLVLYGLP